MDAPQQGGLGGTFAGNPLSCVAALAGLETIEKDGLLARSTAIGKRFEERARGWQKKWQLIGDVRGLGGMCAMELVRDRSAKEPADKETKELASSGHEHGLMTITAGTNNNIMRILVPLVVTDEQFEEGMDVIESGLAQIETGRRFTRLNEKKLNSKKGGQSRPPFFLVNTVLRYNLFSFLVDDSERSTLSRQFELQSCPAEKDFTISTWVSPRHPPIQDVQYGIL